MRDGRRRTVVVYLTRQQAELVRALAEGHEARTDGALRTMAGEGYHWRDARAVRLRGERKSAHCVALAVEEALG